MAALTTAIALAGLAVAGAGTYMQHQASNQQAQAQAQAIDAQKQAEAQRQKAMELDATRRKRQMVRDMINSRATAVATSVAQGAGTGGSNLAGAYGGISGRTGVNELGVNQNEEIGRNIFADNAAASDAYRSAAVYGGQASSWSGVSSLGGMALNNAETISKVGGWFASKGMMA